MVNTSLKNQRGRWWFVAIGTVAACLLLIAFLFWAKSDHVAKAVAWALDPQYNAKIGNTVVRVRPSDGGVFIIGENVQGQAIGGENGSLYYMTSQDGYALHVLVVLPTAGPPGSGNKSARFVQASFDKDSNLHVVWAERNGSYEQYYLKIAAAANTTVDNPWSQTGGICVCGINTSAGIPSFVNGEASHPHVASVLSPYGGSPKIYISRNIFNFGTNGNYIQVISSSDGGATWGNPTTITDEFVGGYVAKNNRIAVAPNDDLFVVLKREDLSNVYGVARIGGVWKPQQSFTNNNSIDTNLEISVGADTNNNGYIFFDFPFATISGQRPLVGYKWINNGATTAWTALHNPGNPDPNYVWTTAGRPKALDAVGTGDGGIWASANILTNGQYYVRTQDGGSSWEFGNIAFDNSSIAETSIAWGGTNQVNVAWKTTNNLNGDNKVQRAFATGGGFFTIPAPSNLTATVNSPTQISLNWTNNSSLYTNLVVERRIGAGGNFTQLIVLAGGTATSFQDPVAENTTYYYRVRATIPTTAGFTDYSNVSNAALTPLIAPTSLITTGATTTSISLQWADNSGAETNYKIERKTPSTNYAEVGSVGAGVTTFNDNTPPLPEGNIFTYRVRAFFSGSPNNYSAYSNELIATTGLNAPTNLLATATSNTEVSVTWNDNATNESGYIIERKLTTDPPANFAEVGRALANSTSFIDRTAVKNTGYDYRVRAYNTNVLSAYSNTDTTVTGPDSPTALTVTAVATNSITLSFTDNSNNETGFEVYRRTLSGSYTITPTFTLGPNGTATVTQSDTTVTPGTIYYYKVRATTGTDPNAGPSGFSNEVSASTTASNANCVVTSTADTLTAGTLRTALTDTTNCNKSGGVITFNLAGSGLQTISVTAALPDVVIGASIGGSCSSSGALVRLDAQTTAPTLVFKGNNTVYGLQLRNAVAGGKAVQLDGTGVKMSCVSVLRT